MATGAERQDTASQEDDEDTQKGVVPRDDAVTRGAVLSAVSDALLDGSAADDAATRDVVSEDAVTQGAALPVSAPAARDVGNARDSADSGLRRNVRLSPPAA